MSRLHLRGRMGLICGISAVALLGAVPAPAPAAPGTGPDRITNTMTYLPVAATAPGAAAGTLTLTLRDGRAVTVPADVWASSLRAQARRALAGGIRPATIVPGDCGYSYIDIKRKSNGRPIHVKTGFYVIDWAEWYTWTYTVRGPQNYSHTETPSGGLFFQHDWSDTFDSPHNERNGHWQAWVTAAESYAITDSGLCISGGPVEVGDY